MKNLSKKVLTTMVIAIVAIILGTIKVNASTNIPSENICTQYHEAIDEWDWGTVLLNNGTFSSDTESEDAIFHISGYGKGENFEGIITYDKSTKTLTMKDINCDENIFLEVESNEYIKRVVFEGNNEFYQFTGYNKNSTVEIECAYNATATAGKDIYDATIADNTTYVDTTLTYDGYVGGKTYNNLKGPRLITDKTTGVISTFKPSAEEDGEAKLIVNNLEKESDLYKELAKRFTDYNIVGAYNVKIEGKYDGNIKLTFPVDSKYNGESGTVLHKKSDGTTEEFQVKVQNGQVQVTVSELSPFMIAIANEGETAAVVNNSATDADATEIDEVTDNTATDEGATEIDEVTDNTATDEGATENRELDKTPKTGEQNYIVEAILLAIITMGAIGIIKKKD